MKRKLGLAAAMVALVMVLVGCKPEIHNHVWDAGTLTEEPTCTEKGKKVFKCTDCGEERTDEIAAKGHSYGRINTTDNKHWKECSVCEIKIDEAPHSFVYKGNCWQECECSKKIPVSLDTLGTYDSTKKTFGVYPQTIKADNVTVDKTVKNTEITGAAYYLGSDGAWYAECTENACGTGNQYKYSNGNQVAEKDAGSVKYFKVEPIEWVYLGGTECLHSKKILTANVQWHASSNNYKNSNIRKWLNKTFYDSAFTEKQKKEIKTTTVYNNALSTGYVENIYACENTSDKVYLLCYLEAISKGNGYNTNDDRIKFPTDYALANYCSKLISSSYGGGWWLRSPDSSIDSSFARVIGAEGYKSGRDRVYDLSNGVVPALSISE